MILSSRDAWRRGGSAPAWPRLFRTRSNKEETRSDIKPYRSLAERSHACRKYTSLFICGLSGRCVCCRFFVF